MACRVPGAHTPEELWHNLVSGREAIVDFTDEELATAGVSRDLLRDPAYVRRGAPLRGMELWDHAFFRVAPRDARIMDPQHRQFLEVAWEAFEDAGHVPGRTDGRTGVFAGCGPNTYYTFNLLTNPALVEQEGLFLLRHMGNDKDFLASRVAYHLDLTGPAVTVQTACSTSLAAVHLACQSLHAHECDMALAGGSSIRQPHAHGYLCRDGEVLSADGRCRPFDAAANGTVIGDGVAAVLLRRLSDAVEGGDPIHAVIRGSAMNNDGARKGGYLMPGIEGQTGAIREALAASGVEAESVGYVEAHSSGSPLADATELEALSRAFRPGAMRRGFCALGSIKGNLGHLDTASGVTGLIKTVLALHHGQIPPTLHFREPAAELQLDESPFFVPRSLVPWPVDALPRRAGVSAIGIGGTNVHVVLESAPARTPAPASRPAHLLLLSARTPEAFERAAPRLDAHLNDASDAEVADAAFTLAEGRQAFPERGFAVHRPTSRNATMWHRREEHPGVEAGHSEGSPPAPVFLFPHGPAGFAPSIPRALRSEDRVFRRVVEELIEATPASRRSEVRTVLLGPPDPDRRQEERGLHTFLVQVCLARTWQGWGVDPVAVAGLGPGRIAAEVIGGRVSVAEALDRLGRERDESGDARFVHPRSARTMDPRRLVILTLGPVAGLEAWAGVDSCFEDASYVVSGFPPSGAAQAGALDTLLIALGRLWTLGVDIDWTAFHGAGRRRASLPTYPFERVPHLIQPGPATRPMEAPPPARAFGAREEGGEGADQEMPEERYTEPSTPTERVVAEIWCDVLGLARVDRYDTFLDLGGHSLLAARAVTMMHRATGVPVGTGELNRHTLQQLAAQIDRRRAETTGDGDPEDRKTLNRWMDAARRLTGGGVKR